MRFQLALNVDNLEEAIRYYTELFGTQLHKREPGYANFVIDQPPLKLVLFEAPGAERLNHVGVELFDDGAVHQIADDLEARGVLAERQQEETCCYAQQNKAVSYDPQGLMWEWYRLIEDSPTFFAEPTKEATPELEAPARAVNSRGCC